MAYHLRQGPTQSLSRMGMHGPGAFSERSLGSRRYHCAIRFSDGHASAVRGRHAAGWHATGASADHKKIVAEMGQERSGSFQSGRRVALLPNAGAGGGDLSRRPYHGSTRSPSPWSLAILLPRWDLQRDSKRTWGSTGQALEESHQGAGVVEAQSQTDGVDGVVPMCQ